jgi:hypothetical protein
MAADLVYHYHPGLLTKKPSMYDAPFCTPNQPYLSHGGGHMATEERAEVTCKRCLAKMAGPAKKEPKQTARPRKVIIWITNRLDGTTCIQAEQGDTDLLFEVVPTDQAEGRLQEIMAAYPAAKIERA